MKAQSKLLFVSLLSSMVLGASPSFAGSIGEGTEGGGGGRTRSSNPAPVNDIIDSIMLARQYGTFYLIDTYNVCVNNHMGSKAKCTLVSGGLEASLAKRLTFSFVDIAHVESIEIVSSIFFAISG